MSVDHEPPLISPQDRQPNPKRKSVEQAASKRFLMHGRATVISIGSGMVSFVASELVMQMLGVGDLNSRVAGALIVGFSSITWVQTRGPMRHYHDSLFNQPRKL